MKIISLCNKVIEYSFYALFFLVPLVFSSDTSELFEFNKMWLTFIATIVIMAGWLCKMIVQKEIFVQKTPLDIPIGIFLISLIISSVFSLDSHVSLWGYYSRFNGGLLSMVSYILLYYAFVSNFSFARGDTAEGLPTARTRSARRETSGALAGMKAGAGPRATEVVKRILIISLAAGAVVALWGLPSHFGYDPTCFIFRGTFDVSCWTSDFQPKVRIFSTLGQPAWLGAYLALLIPIAIAFAIEMYRRREMYQTYQKLLIPLIPFLLLILFYLDLLFTQSRAAFLAVWISLSIFVWLSQISLRETGIFHRRVLTGVIVSFLVLTFFVGTPFAPLNKLTFESLKNSKLQTVSEGGLANPSGGGTDSGKIRLLVWQGALSAWRHNPVFGTGVETFAFAYYKYRPVEHNLTSEWNFLYNKAHNEYLNFLATTGLFGLLSYLSIIIVFLWVSLKKISNIKYQISNKLDIGNLKLVIIGIIAGYISILITNFFGFSVVITNVYLFLIPAFVFVLISEANIHPPEGLNFTAPFHLASGKRFKFLKSFSERVFQRVAGSRSSKRVIGDQSISSSLSFLQKLDIFVTVLIAFYLIFNLANFWLADRSYGLGENLSRAGEYRKAYLSLNDAVSKADFEPVFRDETAVNDAQLAVSLLSASKTAAFAQKLSKDAVLATSKITEQHPNNIVFWKSQVRIFYTLSQADPRYLPWALDSLKKAKTLAPTDANISYNLGLLYGQSGDSKKAIETLKNTIKLKPNYTNAYYALGLFYHQKAVNDKGVIVDSKSNQKAIEQMKYILEKLDPNNQPAKEALKTWGVTQLDQLDQLD